MVRPQTVTSGISYDRSSDQLQPEPVFTGNHWWRMRHVANSYRRLAGQEQGLLDRDRSRASCQLECHCRVVVISSGFSWLYTMVNIDPTKFVYQRLVHFI